MVEQGKLRERIVGGVTFLCEDRGFWTSEWGCCVLEGDGRWWAYPAEWSAPAVAFRTLWEAMGEVVRWK